VEDNNRGASFLCSVKKEEVGPVAEKGVDPGETATRFYFSFSQRPKRRRIGRKET
jgi:hypothetical protein